MGPPTALQKQYMSSSIKPKKELTKPRPSASILLISPSNEILLLYRVQTSRSFPAAHVFPGGNLSSRQDGEIPTPNDPKRHQDGPAYRLGAIRECFEESGILLARRSDNGAYMEVEEVERERARKEIHAGELLFSDWVASQGGIVDTDSLIPFTRWITPTNIPRRFTTQMYIAFLPLTNPSMPTRPGMASLSTDSRNIIPMPTSDGGIEHTAAQFLPCAEWLRLARANEIILFPPQFYLIHLLSTFLTVPFQSLDAKLSLSELQDQRDAVLKFIQEGEDEGSIKWTDKVISPQGLLFRDGRSVLALDKPGAELEGSGRGGDLKRVVLVRFSEEGPRDVEVRLRNEVLAEAKKAEVKSNL